MQIKNGIRKWSLFALGLSCVLSFGGSAFGAQTENGEIDTSKKVEISWYFVGNGEEDTKKVEAAINNYIEKYTDLNCTLKLNCIDWINYDEKMAAKIASGESFDICFTSYWMNDYYTNYTGFWNLDEALPIYAPKTKAMLGEDYLNGAKINGKLYAIPCNKVKGTQYGLIVREDVANNYNMDLSGVKTLDDMEPFLTTIKDLEPDMEALHNKHDESAIGVLPYEYIVEYGIPGAVKRNTSDYKVVNQYVTEEAKAYYGLMRKYYLKGFMKKDSFSSNPYGDGSFFVTTETLYPAKLRELEEAYGYKYISIPLTKPYMRGYESTGSMLAISKTSKYPERALRLIERVNTDPQLNNLINFGIEGDHYKVVGKSGNTKIIRPTNNNEAYNPSAGWMFGNQFLNYVYENQAPDIWAKTEVFNNQLVKSKILGFHFDASPVANEMAKCNEVYRNYVMPLQAGELDPDKYVPIMEKEFKKAGSDKVIAEMQKQLESWRSKAK